MLFTREDAEAIAEGKVTVTIRSWKRPQAKAGGVYQTMVGWIEVDEVEHCLLADVEPRDLTRAGFASHEELAEFDIALDDEVDVVRFHACPAPARIDVGADIDLTDDDVIDLRTKLDRMDERSTDGPWTMATLRHIALAPGTRSADMAEDLDRDQSTLKADVRKLKRQGLTRSLDKGYELSPRGRALLDALDGQPG